MSEGSPTLVARPVSSRSGWGAALILCVAAMTVALPLIESNYDAGRVSYDQNRFHLVAIRQFARQWPNFDFADYASATTPGYHLTLAAVDRFVSADLRVLKLVGAIFSLGLLITLARSVQRRSGLVGALVLCIPLISSIYFFSSLAWLLPDNAGWWGVLAILLVALRPKVDNWTYLLGGMLLIAAVLVRQSHLWVAAPLATAVWMGPEGPHAPKYDSHKAQIIRMAPIIIAAVAAFSVFASFAILWHGPVPPSQIIFAWGMNFAGPTMALAVVAMLGIFFTPFFLPRLGRDLPQYALLGAAAGFVVGIVPRTDFAPEFGRKSGIFNAVRHFPVFAHRAPLMIAMATLGGALIVTWLMALPRRERAIWATAVLTFGVSQIVVKYAFQRYDEPLILIAAALSAASFYKQAPRWAWIGPILLSLALATITVVSLR